MSAKYFDAAPRLNRRLPTRSITRWQRLPTVWSSATWPRWTCSITAEPRMSHGAHPCRQPLHRGLRAWALAKDEAKADELAFVIYNLLEAIRIAAHLLMPLMPQTSVEALRRLSCEGEAASDDSRAFALGACLLVVSPSRRAIRCSRVWRRDFASAISAICCLDVRAWPQRSMPFRFKTPPSC